jgi:hypothetical protein
VKSRIDSVNRVLLSLLGLAALAGGVVILLFSVRVFGDSWADQPVLQQETRDFADRNAGWFWAAIAIGAAVLALLALRWLLAQASTSRVGSLNLEPDRSQGHTRLSTGAVADAVEEEVERLHGVDRASVRVLGKPTDPLLRLDVKVGEDGDLGYIRSRLEQETVPRARQAIGIRTLPVWVRLAVASEERRSVS